MLHHIFGLLLFSSLSIAAITITADSFQAGFEASKASDGDTSTFWHSQYSPAIASLPHTAIIDLGSSQSINAFTYLPRQTGNKNGNIGLHTLSTSTDNTTWTLLSNSTFADDRTLKTTTFTAKTIRYFRLTCNTEAGNRGPWSSAAEFGVTVAPHLGVWGDVIDFPLVPAGGFVMHDSGKVMTFAAFKVDTFSIGASGNTRTAVYDPASGIVTAVNVINTQHVSTHLSRLFSGLRLSGLKIADRP